MHAEIRTYFCVDDKGHTGDYTAVEVWLDGKLVRTFGDFYHDKGRERAEAFVEGLRYFTENLCECQSAITIERTEVADYVR